MDDNDLKQATTNPRISTRTGGTGTGGRRVWSVDETAEQLGISRAHAYELIARREIPHLRLGRRIVVPVHALDELLDRAVRGAQ